MNIFKEKLYDIDEDSQDSEQISLNKNSFLTKEDFDYSKSLQDGQSWNSSSVSEGCSNQQYSMNNKLNPDSTILEKSLFNVNNSILERSQDKICVKTEIKEILIQLNQKIGAIKKNKDYQNDSYEQKSSQIQNYLQKNDQNQLKQQAEYLNFLQNEVDHQTNVSIQQLQCQQQLIYQHQQLEYNKPIDNLNQSNIQNLAQINCKNSDLVTQQQDSEQITNPYLKHIVLDENISNYNEEQMFYNEEKLQDNSFTTKQSQEFSKINNQKSKDQSSLFDNSQISSDKSNNIQIEERIFTYIQKMNKQHEQYVKEVKTNNLCNLEKLKALRITYAQIIMLIQQQINKEIDDLDDSQLKFHELQKSSTMLISQITQNNDMHDDQSIVNYLNLRIKLAELVQSFQLNQNYKTQNNDLSDDDLVNMISNHLKQQQDQEGFSEIMRINLMQNHKIHKIIFDSNITVTKIIRTIPNCMETLRNVSQDLKNAQNLLREQKLSWNNINIVLNKQENQSTMKEQEQKKVPKNEYEQLMNEFKNNSNQLISNKKNQKENDVSDKKQKPTNKTNRQNSYSKQFQRKSMQLNQEYIDDIKNKS